MNTHRTQPVKTTFRVRGGKMAEGHVYWYALEPEFEIFEYRPEHAIPQESALDAQSAWTFPAASVSAVELDAETVEVKVGDLTSESMC